MDYIVSWEMGNEQGLVQHVSRRAAERLVVSLVAEQYEAEGYDVPDLTRTDFETALAELADLDSMIKIEQRERPWAGRVEWLGIDVWFSEERDARVPGIAWDGHQLSVDGFETIDTSGGFYALLSEYSDHYVLITDDDGNIPGPHSGIVVGLYEGSAEDGVGGEEAVESWDIYLDKYETIRERDVALRELLDTIQRRYG